MKPAARILLTLFLLSSVANGATGFEFFPGAKYDPDVPTLESVVGQSWGEKILTSAEIESYIKVLGDSSARLAVIPYGSTWEGRTLYYLVIASAERIAAIEDIKRLNRVLANPGDAQDPEPSLWATHPSTVWLAYGIHGNEISSPDAALLTAYHLIAAQDDPLVDKIFESCIVVLDPLQNPDGRDRFVNYFRQTVGRWPDSDPQSAEHNETWPRGRTNHYLFDMNRDWFALTQVETQGRVKAYLEWFPQVFVDLHEMGGDSTYYFAPPAAPHNPVMTEAQTDWLEQFGRNNARWFDQMKWDYFTSEVFDSFYPGYGEGWPMYQGSIGMTYEQASVRGMILERSDNTTIHFRESIQHHFIASLSTIELAADKRESLLRYFYDFRKTAISDGAQGETKEYLIPPGPDPARTTKLANVLLSQGFQVKRASRAFTHESVVDHYGNGEVAAREFPAGTLLIPLSQPGGRLLKTLFDPDTPMDDEFLAEQERRRKRNQRDEFYDLTGWSVPFLYDLPCYSARATSSGTFEALREPIRHPGVITGGSSTLAYLVPWGTQSAVKLLAALQKKDIRVFSTDAEFQISGRLFSRGSLIIKAKNNPENLFELLQQLATETGAEIISTDSSWVESGANFGSNQVNFIEKPRVAMAYNIPTSVGSVGATRYLIEQAYSYPVTLINSADLRNADLSKYNVLILPSYSRYSGDYTETLGERGIERIKNWVRAGGTLVGIADSSSWLTEEKVGILSTRLEYKDTDSDTKQKTPTESSEVGDSEEKPRKERPDSTPGAILRVLVDNEHWLGFGYDGDTNVIVEGSRIFAPLERTEGQNVARYASGENLVLSGFTWYESRKQLEGKAYLMHQRLGEGNVVAFAENPTFRAFTNGLDLFLMNAIFLGPAH